MESSGALNPLRDFNDIFENAKVIESDIEQLNLNVVKSIVIQYMKQLTHL